MYNSLTKLKFKKFNCQPHSLTVHVYIKKQEKTKNTFFIKEQPTRYKQKRNKYLPKIESLKKFFSPKACLNKVGNYQTDGSKAAAYNKNANSYSHKIAKNPQHLYCPNSRVIQIQSNLFLSS